MDSRKRRRLIAGSLAAIALVLLAVLYANRGAGSASDTSGSIGSTSGQSAASGSGGTTGGQTDTSGGAGTTSGQTGTTSSTGGASGQTATTDSTDSSLRAFLQDATFFDEEENAVLTAAKDNSNRLSLVVTSVEKDLRVQVVNHSGDLVTGESFYIGLSSDDGEDLGEYKDLDQDGVVYIADLSAGDYAVELLPISGYKAPTSTTRVHVKDKVEYLAIEDISLLLLTEDDIDAEAEDTGTQDAADDADKTENSRFTAGTGKTKVGIDVSKWNGEIDWDKVKNAGVQFAIIRAGYRGSKTGSLVEDPCFRTNIKGAIAAGIDVGVYFFTQAVDEKEAVEEASAVLSLVAEYDLSYPIFIDTEGAGGSGRADALDVETRTLVCEAFCRTIENAGYTAGVYASRNWYNQNLQATKLEQYYIWLAEYRSVPLYQGYYRMWQYTSKGSIDGISGRVDLNYAYE